MVTEATPDEGTRPDPEFGRRRSDRILVDVERRIYHAEKRISDLEAGRHANAVKIALLEEATSDRHEVRKTLMDLREEFRVFRGRIAAYATLPTVVVALLEIYRLATHK